MGFCCVVQACLSLHASILLDYRHGPPPPTCLSMLCASNLKVFGMERPLPIIIYISSISQLDCSESLIQAFSR